ncbi:MAG: rhamnogalacturonan acetylesterase [Polyangiaceae bacterium]
MIQTARRTLTSLFVFSLLGCSPAATENPSEGNGGSTALGGANGSGGSGTGGTNTALGGSGNGGANSNGGAPTSGGTASGGASSGGASSGGNAGSSNGGQSAGGTTTSGGRSSGGSTNGGTSSGGTTSGGATSGGRTNGGTTSGGTTSGGTSTTGGVTSGGSVSSGGKASGGAASGGAASGGSGPLTALTVHIAGDSTVSTYTLDAANPKSQAGWGQMLQPLFDTKATIVNDAIGGRTARRYIQEGRLDAILNVIKAGDYLLIQFGTNDSNTTATYDLNGVTYPYYAAADTDFKTYLQQYITGAQGKKAIPILVTPPPRNSAYCNGGRSLANYGQAMIDLGKADGVAVVDLGLKAHTYLKAICPKPTTGTEETFFKVNADNTIDGTHFQENGARKLAGFVAEGIRESGSGLAAYLK